MKKLLAIIMAGVMLFTLFACGKDEEETPDTPQDLQVEDTVIGSESVAPTPDEEAVKAYFDKNGDAFLNSMVESFSNSSNGFTCKGELEVNGVGVTVKVLIDGLNDLPDDLKQQMQAAYNEIGTDFDAVLALLQTEVPQLKTMTLMICEQDGDTIAVIDIE
ncbi:MAG: hypothetical protein IKU84_06175 [Clostridia bacterium]|nr:hypothetical protein [Clostridia bacterium]